MLIKRLNIGARTDGAQVHHDAAFFHGKFFGSGHNFAAEALSLPRGIDAEKAEVHAVTSLLEIDATRKGARFFENQELAGAQILQRFFAVDAIATDEWTLDLKRRVDKQRERVGVRILSYAKRKSCS
jgi:hypothetical protein